MLKGLVFAILSLSQMAWAVDYVSTTIFVSRRTEQIGNEEFLLADEKTQDYLDSLPRPTETFKLFRYRCQVKSRYIRPMLQQTGSLPSTNTYVELRMVYDIKDCVKVN